jgi:three-Cys-motif partner protein
MRLADTMNFYSPGSNGMTSVGSWASTKHEWLSRYVDITSAARNKYLAPKGSGGASYIDLFCGPAASDVRGESRQEPGSAVLAWRTSVKSRSPFSCVYINDSEEAYVTDTRLALEAEGAKVIAFNMSAKQAASEICRRIQSTQPQGLHFSFIDPFSIDLDFEIIKDLASIKRMDMMVHLSAMDLQRNFSRYEKSLDSPLDRLAPGRRDHIDPKISTQSKRDALIHYWRDQVNELGLYPPDEHNLITGSQNQNLYWLLVLAKHKLAQTFWKIASNPQGQQSLF